MKRWIAGMLVCMLIVCASVFMAGCQSQNYTPQPKTQAVSASALIEDGTLRVGVNVKNNPMAGMMSDGTIVGIDADVAAFLADQLGLKLVLVDVGDDPATALAEKKVDVVLGVKASDDDTGAYWKSEPYLYTAAALFGTQAETSIPALDSAPSIAGQVDEATGQKSLSAGAVVKLYGQASLVGKKDLEEALGALAGGSVRYAAGDAVKGLYAANYNGFNVKVLAVMEEPNGYCIAVAASNSELQGAVSTAMGKLMAGGAMDIVQTTWLGAPIDLKNMTVIKSAAANSASNKSASSASASKESADKSAESANTTEESEESDESADEESEE